MDALATMRLHYSERLLAARTWAGQGGKVVGYLCDNVPDELISAAGFFPLRISGDPDSALDTVRRKVDRLYTPDVVNRPDFVGSMLNRLLDGTYGLLDYMIVPHNRNAIQAIFRELQDAHRFDPTVCIPTLFYLDKAWSPYFASEIYNRDRVMELKAVLETWSGQPIADEDLRSAIATGNENRRLLGEVARLRTARRPRLSGVDALNIIGASMFMAKADHNALLAEFLASADQLPERNGPRIFLGGSPLDHTRVYEAIESCGATVVAEDHCWGARSFDLPVEAGGDPLLALASRFHRKPACSITFPISETVQACARRAAAASADAAIFYVMDQDWSQNWETPAQVKQLQAGGTPTLHLKRQAYGGGGTAALSAVVTDFLASIQKVDA